MKIIITISRSFNLLIWCLMICSSCTYSVNLIHSSGVSEDVIDENQSAKPDINLSVPTL